MDPRDIPLLPSPIMIGPFLPRSHEQIVQARAIYETSFPPAERAPFADLLASLAGPHAYGWAAADADGLIGFAFAMTLEGTGVEFLTYLAVAPTRRGHGVGSALLWTVIDALRARGNTAGLLWEVESDDVDEEIPEAERALRRRRIAFYRRHGATIVSDAPAYRAPNLAGAGTIPMKLMWRSLTTPPEGLAGDRLRRCIEAIYRQGYGLPDDHPLVRETLAGLEPPGLLTAPLAGQETSQNRFSDRFLA